MLLEINRKAPNWRAMTFAVAVSLALIFGSPLSASAQKASATADLPTGPMQAKATTACLECHEARIILQQRLSKAAWTKEVDKMTKWGAVVDPADRDALIDYLSTNFSPDKPVYEPQRTSPEKDEARKSK
jgi:mono/diheme cytochrome c family protein